MNRRTFLTVASTGVASALAGCSSGTLESGDPPQLEWEFEWQNYLNQSVNVTTVVTGEAENVGGQKAEEYKLICTVLGTDGSTIAEKWTMLRDVEPAEEQQFFFEFQFSTTEAKQIGNVEVTGEWPSE